MASGEAGEAPGAAGSANRAGRISVASHRSAENHRVLPGRVSLARPDPRAVQLYRVISRLRAIGSPLRVHRCLRNDAAVALCSGRNDSPLLRRSDPSSKPCFHPKRISGAISEERSSALGHVRGVAAATWPDGAKEPWKKNDPGRSYSAGFLIRFAFFDFNFFSKRSTLMRSR